MPKVAVVMGSHKDFSAVEPCVKQLAALGIEVEARVLSAHRTPEEAAAFARLAQENGIEVLIAAAGKAAHLAGVLAAYTVLPVIGLPISASQLDGMDALLAIVQMRTGGDGGDKRRAERRAAGRADTGREVSRNTAQARTGPRGYA